MRQRQILGAIIAIVLTWGTSFGQTWQELTTGTSYILYDISFPPGQNTVGYAAGMQYTYNANGVVIKTTDGGDTWSTILGGVNNTLDGIEAIAFITPDTGFIAGWNNYFAKTTDGGATWTTITVGSGNWYFHDLDFYDSNNGIAVSTLNAGGDEIYVTSDGGATWTAATGLNQNVMDAAYANSTTLYAVGGDEKISKSTDGGLTWSLIYSGAPTTYFFGVDFDGNFGVVGGENGKMFSTTNGGATWSTYSTGYENLYGVHVFNSDSAYIGGTDENMYKTTNSGNTWTSEFNGSGTSNIYKIKFTDNNTGYACGSQGYIIRKGAPFIADFTADNDTTCTGSTVNFTDLTTSSTSWAWTFEGGTPSTSTNQNPSVVYNTPGTYDVTLTVSNATDTLTVTKIDYITVLETPGQANTPVGDDELCTGNAYYYSISPVAYAENYEWEIDPADAGTLTWDTTEATLITSNSWTGNFTIRVRATNMCGDGNWSDYLYGSIFLTPSGFNITGGGGYCSGGDGVEIGLDGSELGVDYELYLDDNPTGNIVAGTGDSISFGLQTAEGYYTVTGYTTNCSEMMTGQVQVTILLPPMEPGTPTGPTSVCNNDTSNYESTGSDDADSYDWTLTPDDAGTLTENGLSATVEWSSDFSGTATVGISGINSCGEGAASVLDVEVGTIPTPVIYGLDDVCENSVEFYTADSHEGSTYTWDVTGGTVTDGQGTAEVTILWGEHGSGYITVSEESNLGCIGSSDEFDVIIEVCSGIEEKNEHTNLLVFPNPVQNKLNIEISNPVLGKSEIVITNVTGQIVLQRNVEYSNYKQSLQFDLTNLENGLYIIKLKHDNAVVLTRQFVKN